MIARGFYFLRHGETNANVEQRLQGHLDVPLNDNGRQQAYAAAIILQRHPIDLIVASPLSRAAETANIVNQFLGKTVVFDNRLKERYFGFYEGKTSEEIKQWKTDTDYQEQPIEVETGYPALPDGENYQSFHARVTAVISDVLNEHPEKNILFVSHGGFFTALYQFLLQEKLKTKNAHPYRFKYSSDKWALHCLVTATEEQVV